MPFNAAIQARIRASTGKWQDLSSMKKIEVARRQLGTASDLFIRNEDAVSVHTLACAAREILERLCSEINEPSLLALVETIDSRPIAEMRNLANQYARALKHHRPGNDDDQLLHHFSDQHNDFILFIAWSDYRRLTGQMPVEAQALYSWVEALYPHKMSIQRDFAHIPELVGLSTLGRNEQKQRLASVVEKASSLPELLEHPDTERQSLKIQVSDAEGPLTPPPVSHTPTDH